MLVMSLKVNFNVLKVVRMVRRTPIYPPPRFPVNTALSYSLFPCVRVCVWLCVFSSELNDSRKHAEPLPLNTPACTS